MTLEKTKSEPLWQKGGRSAASLIIGGIAATLTEVVFDLMVEKFRDRRASKKK